MINFGSLTPQKVMRGTVGETPYFAQREGGNERIEHFPPKFSAYMATPGKRSLAIGCFSRVL